MKERRLAILAFSVTLVGCGSATSTGADPTAASPDPDGGAPASAPPEVAEPSVTSIPPGDAKGKAFTGPASVIVRVTSCAGSCGPVEVVAGVPNAYCKPDQATERRWQIAQTDGVVTVEPIDLGFALRTATGGINTDGSLDVGAAETEPVDTARGAVRVRGKLTPRTDKPFEKWSFTGTATTYVHGAVRGVAVDCVGTYTITPKP